MRLFVDMDGTLARFHDEVQYLERMWEKGFFENLEPFEKNVQAIKLLHEHCPDVEIYVLSSAIDGEPPYCKVEKNNWIDRQLPFIDENHRLFPLCGTSKTAGLSLTKNDMLFDDYTKNLLEWEQAGGTGVKCKNNINCKGLVGEPWNKAVIDISKSPAKIAIELANEMGCQLNFNDIEPIAHSNPEDTDLVSNELGAIIEDDFDMEM